jgi:hypothetical protein
MLFSSTVIQAQEIIKLSNHLLKKVVTGKRLKIDGVIAGWRLYHFRF